MTQGSATERLELALGRIAERNDTLKLVTTLDIEGARAAAAAADLRSAAGKPFSPLDGLLVGIKDNIAVQGLPWTAGLAGWRKRIAGQDATVVTRLRAAGAVIVGMLNMHEAALGATTDNQAYGRAANPLDPARTPGGSSGGSGGAVAAGFVEAALGTDTMGSVRIPAAYCGIFGLKPTENSVPGDGLTDLSPSLDTIGPLATSPDLLNAVLEVISNPKAKLRTALPQVGNLRVGIPREISTVEIEHAVAEGLNLARRALERQGARVEDISLAGWNPGSARRGGLLLVEAEGAVALARLRQIPGAMTDALREMLDYGANLPSERLVEALSRIRSARRAARCALRDVDVLLMPTAPQIAFRHEDPVPDNQADFSALANLSGLPALSVPVPGAGAMPAAVQLIGPDWSEGALAGLTSSLTGELESS